MSDKKTCILLFYFSRVHWGCHLILKCFIWIYMKKLVWILLLVHITLHGMIGGLLKHFPKAVWGIIFFIYKTVLNVKQFSISVSMHPSPQHSPQARVWFELREREVFVVVWRLGGRSLFFVSNQNGIVMLQGHSAIRIEMQSLLLCLFPNHCWRL